MLSDGYELLLYFLVSVTPTTVLQLVYTCVTFQNLFSGKVESVIQTLMFWMLEILIAVVYESVVFGSVPSSYSRKKAKVPKSLYLCGLSGI